MCDVFMYILEMHGNFPAVLPRFPAGNPAVKGTEREGYPRKKK